MSDRTLYRKTFRGHRPFYEPIGFWPAEALQEGLWLVQRLGPCSRQLRMDRYADLPEPVAAAALELRRDVICAAILECMYRTADGVKQSADEVTSAIITAVAEAMAEKR